MLVCFKGVSGVFPECFRRLSKNVINKLTTMSKNPAFSQKFSEDWLTLPERQELFAGLVIDGIFGGRPLSFVNG